MLTNVNRKGYYSIVMQTVVDSKYLFRDVYKNVVTHLLLCIPPENTTNAVARNSHQKACAAFLMIQNGSFKLLFTGNHITR